MGTIGDGKPVGDLSAFGPPHFGTCAVEDKAVDTYSVVHDHSRDGEGVFPLTRYANFLSAALGKAGDRKKNPVVFLEVTKEAADITLFFICAHLHGG